MTVWGSSRITEEKLVNLTMEYDKWKIGFTKASVCNEQLISTLPVTSLKHSDLDILMKMTIC